MTKSIVAGIVALVLVVACGVVEVVLLKNSYDDLHAECLEVMRLADKETLSLQRFETFRNNWTKLRETSELFLPHMDVYELNLRFAESQAYVETGDFHQLKAQLSIIEELLRYVPHLMIPSPVHIL